MTKLSEAVSPVYVKAALKDLLKDYLTDFGLSLL